MRAWERLADPRPRLALGVLVFVILGFGARTLVGPSPAIGRRINHAIEQAGNGDRQGAYETLHGVVVARPHHADAWMRTGKALAALDRPFEAAVYLRKAAELDTTTANVQVAYVQGLIRAGELEQATTFAAKRLEAHPDDGGMLYLASALAAARGQAEFAGDLFRKAVANGAYRPDRFRQELLFDPVRNDPVFLQAVYDTRIPDAFGALEDFAR